MKYPKNVKLVSIISGYYNRERLVDESLQSLINQTYENIEIIIFDDCSTDNTYNELKKYEHYSNVQIIKHDSNIGFVNGLIRAINLSRGEYIAIHGSGDYSYPDRVKKQVAKLEENDNVSIVGCEDILLRGDGEKITTKRWPPKNFYNSIVSNAMPPLNGSHIMFKRCYYNKVGGYRSFFKYAQDLDLLCRLSLISDYDIVPEVLYNQKRHLKESVSGDPIKRIKQIYYMNFAIQCIKLRKLISKDFIDLYGDEAFIALNINKTGVDKLSVHGIKLYNAGQIEDAQKVYIALKNEPFTFKKAYFNMLYRGLIPVSLSSRLYKMLHSFNKNSKIKLIKDLAFNKNKV